MNSPMTNADSAANGQVVVFPPERGIGVLAVAPPYPPGYKPQSDGALGININMVHGDRDGLLVFILAYLNMAIGDYIKVYIETKNAPVAEFSVTEAHFDAEGNAKNIPFYISAKNMEARFAPLLPKNQLFWFEVERVSGNGTEGSPPVPLLYKYPAPGEADTDGGKPFNQGLKLPVSSESIIDQTVIDEGMFVTVLAYFNQSIGDVVVLAFGPLLLESTVTTLGDLNFELTPQMLASLAPTNSLVVRWEVFDVVENTSGWSDALILTAKPGTVLLTAPIFEQADLDNVVNHDGLMDGPLNVLITGVFAAKDLIELVLEGLTKGGDPVIQTFSRTLTAASRSMNFAVENEWVRNLIGGSARASYQLIRAGKTQFSKPADATFSGSSLPLGLPIVDPLVNNKLPVDTATATVQVAKYWPLKIGAIVKLNWQTTDQDGIKTLFIFQLIVTDPTQQVIFHVPAKYIAPYANTPLTVQCTVTNPGEVEVFSNLLQLMFGEEVIGTPLPPRVDEAEVDGKNLVPFKARNTLTIVVPTNPAFKPDARLTVSWIAAAGTPSGGSHTSPATLVSAGLSIRIPNSVVAFCLGTVVRVFYTIIQGGKTYVSGDLNLSVLLIPQESSDLPTPAVAGVTTKELDVSKLVGNEKFSVAQWFLQAYGQGVWLRYDGFLPNGNATEYVLWTGQAHKYPPSELITQAPIPWLKTLADQSVMTVRFGVNFNGVANKAKMVNFPRRTYIVKALVATKPSIPEIRDSKGLVLHNGTTYDTKVTVTVTADPNQSIQLYDGAKAIGAPIPLDSKGNGTTTLSALEQKVFSLTARAVYGNQLESSVRIFTRKAHLAVTLTSVKHSRGELGEGGSTASVSVTLEGQVTPLYRVQIYHNNSAKNIVQSNASGFWTTPLPIGAGLNTVYAKAVATGLNSNSRSFTRVVPITSENFDQYSTRHVSPGLNIPLNSMTIYYLGGTGFIGIAPLADLFTGPYPQIPGRSYGQTLEMHWKGLGTSQHMRIRFNWGYSSVSFFVRFAQTPNLWIRFLDINNSIIHQYTLPPNFDAQSVSYSHPSIDIWGIEVQTSQMDLISFDCFQMTYR
ncbi:hypothetical protein [Pseudomonas sp. IT-P294]|uniref:hypothetical protein n=1 Tax=Pseudomonas sp. IT-P294 TaxID=3026454 RepID=UPI0039DFBA1D